MMNSESFISPWKGAPRCDSRSGPNCRALSEVPASRVSEASNISLLTDRCLVDVIKSGPRVCGAYLLNTHDGSVETVTRVPSC